MMQSQMIAAARRPAMEMQQKNPMMLHDTFFSLKGVQERPVSVATEFMESDFEEDEDIMSDFYDDDDNDGENSPRASLNSGQPSFTTISSYDEVPTPRSSRVPVDAAVSRPTAEMEMSKPVEGPRGPHLFRISSLSADFANALSLSPITPKVTFYEEAFQEQREHYYQPQQPQQPQQQQQQQQREYEQYEQYYHPQQQYPQHHPQHPQHPQPQALPHGITPLPPTAAPTTRRDGPFAFTHQELDTRALAAWSPEHVAQWMLNAGIELQVCERFVENDITGSILITLKFEDLKELGIPSFGVRTNVWNQISGVKSKKAAAAAPAKEQPRSHTPIEDVPDRAVRREVRRMNSCATPTAGPSANKPVLRRGPSTRRIKNRTTDDITPLESVSIVGIEQVLPKPHQCSKGENCSKWRRQQRLLESLRREHPSAIESSSSNGIILIAGDPGNPATARAITPTADEVFRPVSDAVSDALQPAPSVVASSDVMGPGFTPVLPPVALAPETLRAVQARDPQDNVRQFLSFQHAQAAATSEVPPTPPFELYPTVTARPSQAHERLRALPRLDTSAVRAVSRSTAAAAAQQKRHSHGNATPNSGGSLKSASAGHPQSAHPSLGSANNAHYSNYYNYPQSSKTASAAPTSGTSYTYTAIEESPGSRTPLGGGLAPAPYRFGTPFTEVDVPVTAVPTGPIARDTSQSVPPDMNYRMPAAAASASASGPAPTLQRTMSRASARRPSFPVLPSLHENRVGHQRAASAMGHRTVAPAQYRQGGSPTNTTNTNNTNNTLGVRQLQAPPRHVYPWSPAQKNFEKAIAPLSLATATQSSGGSSSGSTGSSSSSGSTTTTSTPASSLSSAAAAKSTPPPNGVTFQGAVKKRRTKMLRHEWNDRFITLKGTRLAVHKDQAHVDRTLEYVDIDDYAIACSTMAASTSKLNAAFKAMNIRRGGSSSGDVVSGISKDDVAAFAFQLIPQDSKAGLRLKKRESTMGGGEAASSSSSSASLSSGGTAPGPADAVNGTGKTHHFAVKSRDNRIEWMRELMLAKAMRQKGAGFEVSVNGNMI